MGRAPVNADLARRSSHGAQVLEHAAAVVVAVHDEGPDAVRDTIARALAAPAPDDVDPVVALVTVLAAAIPADGRIYELLDWVRPLRPVPTGVVTDVDASLLCDVHLLMSGRAVADQVSRPARKEAVRQLTAQGLTATEIGDRIGMAPRAVTRLRTGSSHHRAKEAS